MGGARSMVSSPASGGTSSAATSVAVLSCNSSVRCLDRLFKLEHTLTSASAASISRRCRDWARRGIGLMMNFDINLECGEGIAAIHSHLDAIEFYQNMPSHRG